MDDLTDAGRALRSVAETGNEAVRPFGFVPCAQEHVPGRVCILPDGHAPDAERDAWSDEVTAIIGPLLAGRDLRAGGSFEVACREIAEALRPLVRSIALGREDAR